MELLRGFYRSALMHPHHYGDDGSPASTCRDFVAAAVTFVLPFFNF